MTQNGGYDLTPPPEDKPRKPRPGDPDFVPPTPIIITADKPESETVVVDPDIEKNKGMGILAYICFVIPLVAAPNSRFARFHANQGLITFILWFVAIFGVILANGLLWVVSRLLLDKINILYYFFSCIFTIIQPALLLGALIATIYGIIQAANGEKKKLPLIGTFTLIQEAPTPATPAPTPASAPTPAPETPPASAPTPPTDSPK